MVAQDQRETIDLAYGARERDALDQIGVAGTPAALRRRTKSISTHISLTTRKKKPYHLSMCVEAPGAVFTKGLRLGESS